MSRELNMGLKKVSNKSKKSFMVPRKTEIGYNTFIVGSARFLYVGHFFKLIFLFQ